MRYLIIFLICSSSLWSQNLSEHQWENRVIVIKGKATDSILIEQQFNVFNNIQDQLTERKLVLYKCIDNTCTFYNWVEEPKTFGLENPTSSFKISLIGLDGYEKFKSYNIEEPEVILNLIDTMPLRRREVKENKKNND